MKLNQDFDYRIFDSLIQKNVRFALYRFARQQEINLILQTTNNVFPINDYRELNTKSGFVIAPFNISEDTPVSLIHPDIHLNDEVSIFRYLSGQKFEQKVSHIDIKTQSSLSTPEEYSSVYNTFYTSLVDGRLQKVVLSRTQDIDKRTGFWAGEVFRRACDMHESSFVFLCNTPEAGTWIGISPELLVSEKNEVYKTVALAGTKEISTEEWDDKNRSEQQIVVDYMQEQIGKIGVYMRKEGPFNAQSGKIEHLKTKFDFRLKEGYNIGDLLELLHPSPAVCGFPKKEAFNFILQNEKYDRRYYSGFVGPLNIDGFSRLYVNLRCAQIGKDMLRLYAGGGLMLSSDLNQEWHETENKLQTILSVID